MFKDQVGSIFKIGLFIIFFGSTLNASAQKNDSKKDEKTTKEESKDSLTKTYKDYDKLLEKGTLTTGLFSILKSENDY